MTQQVNLYHDKFRPNTDANLLKLYLSGIGFIIIMLLGYCGYIFYEIRNLESKLEQARKEQTDAVVRFQQIEIQYPKQQINSLLLAEIASSQNKIKALSKIVNKLSDTNSDQYQGFSRYFMALANQATSEAWLNRIFINSQDNAMVLQGSTFESASVPDLLQRLQKETVFRGKKFARLAMKESTLQPNQIDFTVSSQPTEEEAL